MRASGQKKAIRPSQVVLFFRVRVCVCVCVRVSEHNHASPPSLAIPSTSAVRLARVMPLNHQWRVETVAKPWPSLCIFWFSCYWVEGFLNVALLSLMHILGEKWVFPLYLLAASQFLPYCKLKESPEGKEDRWISLFKGGFLQIMQYFFLLFLQPRSWPAHKSWMFISAQ